MDSIYRTIQNQPGLDFSRLVERYSDDKQSRWIESLQTTTEFENVAFALSKGEISQPFFTPEGIHILKVIDRKDMPAYEEVSNKLTERMRNREILDKATEKVVERLKKDWQYTPNLAGMEELLAKGETGQTLFTIDGQNYTGNLFKRFAASHPQAVKRQLDAFIAKSLLDYESKNMDKRHPEIRYALQKSNEEYLVKEVTRQKVDLPAMNDRAGLATYFKFHSSDYRWDSPRYKGVLLHCTDKKTAKQAKKMLKKLPENEWVDKLRQTFNASGTEKIQIEQGTFADGDNKYIDKLVFKKGGYEPLLSYPFTIVCGKKQKGPDDYREVIDRVRKDYRTYLDAYWTRELNESGKVEINQEVLKTVNNN
jgi:peptidyl-prolyl cis-trans isomerase SurA